MGSYLRSVYIILPSFELIFGMDSTKQKSRKWTSILQPAPMQVTLKGSTTQQPKAGIESVDRSNRASLCKEVLLPKEGAGSLPCSLAQPASQSGI